MTIISFQSKLFNSCGKLDNIFSVQVWLYTANWSEGPQTLFFSPTCVVPTNPLMLGKSYINPLKLLSL